MDSKFSVPPPPRLTPSGLGGFADDPPPGSKKSFAGKTPAFPRQELRQAGAALVRYIAALPIHIKLVLLGVVAGLVALIAWAVWPPPTERVTAASLGNRFQYCDIACDGDTCLARCSGAVETREKAPSPERKRAKRVRKR